MLVLIRKLALKRLDAYVQHLRKEGYDAPGIDAYEAHLFTFCLFYATVMTTASIWLWYEIYTKSAFVLIIFTVFTTPVGLAAAWFSTKTWRTVSARLKQYCNALDEGSTINLPRIRK
jgi:hypothetical protein